VPDQPGIWRTDNSFLSALPVSAAEMAALRKSLTTIEQTVHATPMLTALRGVDVRALPRLDHSCGPSQSTMNPVFCRQALPGFIKFSVEEYAREDGRLFTHSDEPPHVDVAFNDPSAAYRGHETGLTDPAGNAIVGPLVEVERIGGLPLYDTGVVILGRNPRPFFVPASREDYLRAQLAKYADTVGAEGLSGQLRAELAALSPEARRTQAYNGRNSPNVSTLVPAPAYEKAEPRFAFTRGELAAIPDEQREATPLFKFNPAYYDAAIPRTAIQLIVVTFVDDDHTRQNLGDRPDLLDRSPITPERLAFLHVSGVGVGSYRLFELERLMNYSGLSALLAAPRD
jgi:hypothetical protein